MVFKNLNQLKNYSRKRNKKRIHQEINYEDFTKLETEIEAMQEGEDFFV